MVRSGAVVDFAARFYGVLRRNVRSRPHEVAFLPGIPVGTVSESFAERLRRLRTDTGYTAVELASVVGASEGTIRQLESGRVKWPNFLLGIRLAQCLKVDPRYLALGEGVSDAERFDAIERRLVKLEKRLAPNPAARR